MNIRAATAADRDEVRDIYLAAFAEHERVLVADLAVNLLAESAPSPTLSLVAESGGALAGHVAFSPVTVGGSADIRGYILAPLAVRPAVHKRGYGSRLVETGKQQLAAMGVDILFVYGDPNYYGRFGFRVDVADGYVPPYPLQYPHGWQAVALRAFTPPPTPARLACVRALCDPRLW